MGRDVYEWGVFESDGADFVRIEVLFDAAEGDEALNRLDENVGDDVEGEPAVDVSGRFLNDGVGRT